MQSNVKVVPGETALAFYTARNPTDEPVVGISSYNVLPYEVRLHRMCPASNECRPMPRVCG